MSSELRVHALLLIRLIVLHDRTMRVFSGAALLAREDMAVDGSIMPEEADGEAFYLEMSTPFRGCHGNPFLDPVKPLKDA